MSSINDSEMPASPQGVQWNEEDWQAVLKRLPSDWEEQAIKLKAWPRLRKRAGVADLRRALLVYAACGFSFRQLGRWASVEGVGCLSERAWRKRVEWAQEWIWWVLVRVVYHTGSVLHLWITESPHVTIFVFTWLYNIPNI